MSFFCKHKWTTVVEKTSESGLEQMRRMGMTPVSYFESQAWKTHLLIMKCDTCGKIVEITNELRG